MNWADITVAQYLQINDAVNATYDEEGGLQKRLIEIVYEIEDADIMTVTDYLKCINSIAFIREAPTPSKVRDTYRLGTTDYTFTKDINTITTAQYFDYTQYQKQDTINMIDFISVFLVPTGHKYNDGYDINVVKEDIKTMGICEALGMMDFFSKAWQHFTKVSTTFLSKILKRRVKTTKEEETLQTVMAQLNRLAKTV